MSVFNKAGHYLLSNAFSAAIPFVLLPILTRKMSLNDYGEFSVFQSLITGFGALVGLNTVGAAARKYYDDVIFGHLVRYNSSCFAILILSLIFLYIVISLLSGVITRKELFDNSLLMIALFISFFNYVLLFRLSQFQIREQSNKYFHYQLIKGGSLFIIVLLFLELFDASVRTVVMAFFTSAAIVAFISMLSLFRSGLIKINSFSIADSVDAIKFGLPLVPHVLGVFLLSYIDRIVIATSLGNEKAAIYMLGVQLSLGVCCFFDALNKALLPWFYRALKLNDPDKNRLIVKHTYKALFMISIVALFLFFVSPTFITIVAGEKYESARDLIGWLFVGQCYVGCYMLFTNYLFFNKKTGVLSVITFLTGLMHLLFVSYAVNNYDLNMVAKIFCISMFVRFIMTALLANRIHPMPWKLSLNE